MANTRMLLLALTLSAALAARSGGQVPNKPDTVVVQGGAYKLRAVLWRPQGRGPFPAILFNHGSWRAGDAASRSRHQRTFDRQSAALGPLFARHGYVFLYLFRRGAGLSADGGSYSNDLRDRVLATKGEEARNQLQLRLLESDAMSDALAGLAFLRALPEVDAHRVAVVGHSFGGSLTLLVAERDTSLRAAVEFAGAAATWERSAQLRARLLAAVRGLKVPVFLVYAANDYSVAPAKVLDAEMTRLGKPHRLKIYPPVGRTAHDGHGFVHLGIATWEPDVFAFLDERMRR
jgi:carboxymethylenebutenolidase